jgi:hypothetical protein
MNIISYIFVVVFIINIINIMLLYIIFKYNDWCSIYRAIESRYFDYLRNKIMYWGTYTHSLKCYLLYILFTDLGKITVFIQLFHLVFLCYFCYLVCFTT